MYNSVHKNKVYTELVSLKKSKVDAMHIGMIAHIQILDLKSPRSVSTDLL